MSKLLSDVGVFASTRQLVQILELSYKAAYTAYPTAANDAPFELLRRLLEGGKPDVPVLLVYAPGDDVCSPRAELEFFRRLPGGSNSALACPNSNHHILNDYDREAAVQAIVEFLEGAE